MVTPPTFAELIDDPAYRKFVKTVPRLPDNLQHGKPWAVWALTTQGKWRGGQFATYAEAWAVTIKTLRNTRYADVSLVSRRKLFTMPIMVAPLVSFQLAWCPRCRRPTVFEYAGSHHAVKVMTYDDPRCYYCGIRQSFAG